MGRDDGLRLGVPKNNADEGTVVPSVSRIEPPALSASFGAAFTSPLRGEAGGVRSRPAIASRRSTLVLCSRVTGAGGGGPGPPPPPARKNQLPLECGVVGGGDDGSGRLPATDCGRECSPVSCSCRVTSLGPVLARFLRAAPHFLPTDPMRERSGVFPEPEPEDGPGVTGCGGSGCGGCSSSERLARLTFSGVEGTGAGSSASSSSSYTPGAAPGDGRDFLRRRRRSRWIGGLGGRRVRAECAPVRR